MKGMILPHETMIADIVEEIKPEVPVFYLSIAFPMVFLILVLYLYEKCNEKTHFPA